MRILRLRKRDGRVVAFERGKIADAIFRASQAAGTDDRFLAEELAGVVTVHLEHRGVALPSSAEVREEVERVLVATGHGKAARAFSAWGERRAVARAARVPVGAPLVGGEPGADDAPWSKAALADALVDSDGLDRSEAEEVARRVEERILASSLPRVSRRLVVALVRAEMFDRGRESRFGRTRTVRVPRRDLRDALAQDAPGRRARSPQALAESVGEAVLAEYLLEDVLPARVSRAHRIGDIHLHDLGAPLRLTALALPGARLLERELERVESTRAGAPRRATGAVAAIVQEQSAVVARSLVFEDLNVLLAPFFAALDDDALAEECRELLLSPPMRAFPQRGGLLRLEVVLPCEVPERLRHVPAPPPAPPQRTYGDYADDALRVARALLREAHLLRREGASFVPDLTVVVRRDAPRDAAARALVKQALVTASELGEPWFVFEESSAPTRGGRWLRLREDEATDPLVFERDGLTAATSCAIDAAGAALRARSDRPEEGLEAALAEIDARVALALEAASARRRLLGKRSEDPSGVLYPLRRGPAPLVDIAGAFHLVEVAGLDDAAAILAPSGSLARRGEVRAALLRRAVERAAAASEGATAVVVEPATPEAPERFERARRARWPDAPPLERAASAGLSRAPLRPRRSRGPAPERVRLRVDSENRPPVDRLLGALEAAERDPAVLELVLDPWPRRVVRGRDAEAL